jgi:type IV pilus assembly protein PilO
MAFPSDPQQRNKVLLGMLAIVGIGFLGYTYVHEPRQEEISRLDSRLERLETLNRGARARTHGGGVAEAETQLALYREQLDAMEGLVPTSEELPDLLDLISLEARQTGVDLALIQPVSAEKEEYYTRRTYDLAVLGSYHQIGEFLTRVASMERIVTPINLSLLPRPNPARQDESRLEAKFAIETYVLPGPGDDATRMPHTRPNQRQTRR